MRRWAGDRTSVATREAALAFLESIRNIAIVTRREIKGFSLNRVWHAVKKECLRLWGNDRAPQRGRASLA